MNQVKKYFLVRNLSNESDIDVLVEFLPETRVGLITLARMERELSELMDGRKVDLRTPEDLSRYFRNEVVQNAEVLYEEGIGINC